MTSNRNCKILLLCLTIITVRAFDNAWYTYVERVESLKIRRAAVDEVDMAPNAMAPNAMAPNAFATADYRNTTIIMEPADHLYYTVDYKREPERIWLDESNLDSPLVPNLQLSSSSSYAVIVALNFAYPFYGYDTDTILVTSRGFLYVGPYSHQFLAATQYVAPLMANFNLSKDEESTVSYYGNDDLFVAQWTDVRLDSDDSDKKFTFQTVIYKNGTIIFSYKNKPLLMNQIPSNVHPVKVGLADAYYHDIWIVPGTISRRVIYEYHSIDVDFDNVDEFSSIVFKPLDTCTSRHNCSGCIENAPVNFKCTWCENLQKCSDGLDRHRQNWVKYNCHIENQTMCATPPNPELDICVGTVCDELSCPEDVQTTYEGSCCPECPQDWGLDPCHLSGTCGAVPTLAPLPELVLPKDCSNVTDIISGVYTVSPSGGEPVTVFCDFDTPYGPWTVIQRRSDGSVNFYQMMEKYKSGFGDVGGEFWLGLDKIYDFVSHDTYKLRIDLTDAKAISKHATYSSFAISDESDGYRLSLGNYSGSARDSLSYHAGMQFTTRDVDNDENINKNCARFHKGAWWYRKCLRSNLNGRYRDPSRKHPDGILWAFWRGYTESIPFVEMKIKRA